jgi:hypothetical protein
VDAKVCSSASSTRSVQRSADSPSDDTPGKDINDKSHVNEATPGYHEGNISDPQLVRTRCRKFPVHQIEGAHQCIIHDRRPAFGTPHNALYSQSFHFGSATKFLPAAIKKYMDWLLVLLLAIPLVEYSYIWGHAQTEIRYGLPSRDYPVVVYSAVQDEFYKNVVIGSYLTSWILIGFTLLLYLKLSRRSKNLKYENSKPA